MADPERVTRILKAVTGIFDQQGLIENKTDRIANQAQVSKGSLFHYFNNKQALYLDAFKYAYRRIYDHMDPKEWQNTPGLTAMITTAIKYELRLQFKFLAEHRLMMQAYADLPYFPKPLRQRVQ